MLATKLARTAPVPGITLPIFNWTGDATQPFAAQWNSYAAASYQRFSRVASPRPAGTLKPYSLRVDLIDGDLAYPSTDFTTGPPTTGNPYGGPFGERAEIGQSNPGTSRLFNVGDDLWISWQTYIPSTFPDSASTWCIVNQWKQVGAMGTPALAFQVGREKYGAGIPYTLESQDRWQLWGTSDTTNANNNIWRGSWPITYDRFAKFTAHIHFDTNPANGFVHLFGDVDGNGMVELYPKTYQITMKDPDSSQGFVISQSHARLGIYRNPTIVGDAWIACYGYTVSTVRSGAEANAFA